MNQNHRGQSQHWQAAILSARHVRSGSQALFPRQRFLCKHPRFYRIFAEKSPAPGWPGIIRSEAVSHMSTRVESDASHWNRDVELSSTTARGPRRHSSDQRCRPAGCRCRQPPIPQPNAPSNTSTICRRGCCCCCCRSRCRPPWPPSPPGRRRSPGTGPVAESCDPATCACRCLVSPRRSLARWCCGKPKGDSTSPRVRHVQPAQSQGVPVHTDVFLCDADL